MLKLALVGRDVSHSLSPRIHSFLLGQMGETCSYEAVSVRPEEFDARVGALFSLDGFNVTAPYKERIAPLLSLEGAARIGAVNTVVPSRRTGYSTDGAGFLAMLRSEGLDPKGLSWLLLGAGGAAVCCAQALLGAGARVCLCGRNEDRLKAAAPRLKGAELCSGIPVRKFGAVVDCTGAGARGSSSLPEAKGDLDLLLRGAEVAVDLVYDSPLTPFLAAARARGAKTANGLGMLFYQAYYADCIFLGRKPDEARADELYRIYREEIR